MYAAAKYTKTHINTVPFDLKPSLRLFFLCFFDFQCSEIYDDFSIIYCLKISRTFCGYIVCERDCVFLHGRIYAWTQWTIALSLYIYKPVKLMWKIMKIYHHLRFSFPLGLHSKIYFQTSLKQHRFVFFFQLTMIFNYTRTKKKQHWIKLCCDLVYKSNRLSP